MSKSQAEYRDCDNCNRPEKDQVCSMKKRDIDICLQNPSRPFWQPVKTDKEKLADFISRGKVTCPIEKDPNGISQHDPGAKCDLGKLQVGLMFKGFPRALLAVAEVVTYGANKYTPLGFLDVPDAVNRYDDAKARHLLKGYLEEKDPESELLHMQHEAWNALAKLEIYLRNKEKELA